MSHMMDVFRDFAALDQERYRELWTACGAPAFYHPAFLRAAQASPLLPIDGAYYLALSEGGRLQGVLVAYWQRSPDPFGTLARTTGLTFDDARADGAGRGGLLGHVAHCYDTRILVRPGASHVPALLLARLKALGAELGVRAAGLLNVADPDLLAVAGEADYTVTYMHDRFYIDLSRHRDFEAFVASLPRHGRQEMKRQLRKFAAEGGTASIDPVDASDLAEVVRLCHLTSARNGTPHYYPEEAFRHFLTTCGDLVSILSVRIAGERVAAVVCLNEPDCMHLWAGGVVYGRSDFSPYSLMFAVGIQHGFAAGLPLIEAGRTNPRIKERLGCQPRPLYSVISAGDELAGLEVAHAAQSL